jgi:hypothetical protein
MFGTPFQHKYSRVGRGAPHTTVFNALAKRVKPGKDEKGGNVLNPYSKEITIS